MDEKKIFIAGGILTVLGLLTWVFLQSSKPQVGTKVDDLGRDHVEVGTKADYNSNPPTSGPHYADWIRAGVYPGPKDDRYLVHSLEHGYVIISYNCDRKISNFKLFFKLLTAEQIANVLAHGLEEGVASPSAETASPSGTLSQNFASADCHKLVDQLISVYEKKGKKKLIVTPRPNLDSKIALTAWTRLDKLGDFDQKRIEQFIDAYRNHGPEQTME